MNMVSQAGVSAMQRDLQTRDGAGKPSATELIVHAARASGRSAFQIGREFRSLNKAPGRIELFEYVRYGLYDNDRYTPEEKARFMGIGQHWSIAFKCSDSSYFATTEDKFLADTILGSGGFPVPETVAVIDQGSRTYGRTPKLSNADDLRGFLADAEFPFFAKIVLGICGLGALQIVGADATHVHLQGREPATYEALLAEMGTQNAYLLQRVVRNHPAVAAHCQAVGTVRMVNLLTGSDVFTPNAVIKLPGGGNIVDHFWKSGNLVADLDPANGTVRRIVEKDGLDLKELPDHPSGTPLVGTTLPYWREILELNREAALMFAPLRYQSFDIAITETGPVILEINFGGGFDLTQNASGRGFLTPQVRGFFRSCGVPGF